MAVFFIIFLASDVHKLKGVEIHLRLFLNSYFNAKSI